MAGEKITTKMIAEAIVVDSQDLKLSKKVAEEVVQSVFDMMASSLAQSDTVYIHGLGTFTPVVRAARKARNPITGAAVQVPEKTMVKFRVAGELKRALNPVVTKKKK
jgi:nucleoid DNA-binding protein